MTEHKRVPYGLRRGWHPLPSARDARAGEAEDTGPRRGFIGVGAPTIYAPRGLLHDPVFVHADACIERALSA